MTPVCVGWAEAIYDAAGGGFGLWWCLIIRLVIQFLNGQMDEWMNE